MPNDDVEARITSLKQEVVQLREQVTLTSSDAAAARVDAADARVLATGADRDVSEVRTQRHAHTKTLNALRQTQLDQGQEMREGCTSQGRKIDELKGEVRTGFDTMFTDVAQITELLTKL
jgi:uncharacterized coiled-coil DUF342 family protein